MDVMRAVRHALVAALLRALFALGVSLPKALGEWVCGALAGLAWALSPSLRRVGDANLAGVFPSLSAGARRRILMSSAARMALNARQCLQVAKGRLRLGEIVEIPECSRGILSPDPRGTVLVTGHLGNWELLGAALSSLGHATFAVVRQPRNTRVASELSAIRKSLGFEEISRGELSALRCLRALKRGALVGLLCDQASEQSSAELMFLHRPAPTALGPALLARRAGARMVFAYLRALPKGRHRLECVEITPSAFDRETMTRVNVLLSAAILADPPSWVWFHARWPENPRPARRLRPGLLGLLTCLSLSFGQPPEAPVVEPCPESSIVQHILIIRNFAYGPRIAQRADLLLPLRSEKLRTGGVLLLHGGGWDDPAQRRGAVADFARGLVCSLGLPVLNADYRLVREGGVFPENVYDVQRAARWMQFHSEVLSVDSGRVVAVGESAGGTLGLLAASLRAPGERSFVAAVVSFSGVTDMPALVRQPVRTPEGMEVPQSLRRMTRSACENTVTEGILERPRDACVDASPVSHAANLPRVLLVHAEGDHLVSADQPLRLRDAALRAHGGEVEVLLLDRSLRARCPRRNTVHGLSPCVLDGALATVTDFLSRAAISPPSGSQPREGTGRF